MEFLTIVLLFGVGVVAGAMNAIAGGATLISFPVLIAVGLPPVVANASNFVALMPGNFAPLLAYKEEIKSFGRSIITLMIVAVFGSIVGAVLLTVSDPKVFAFLIPFLILLATIFFQFGKPIRQFFLSRTHGKNERIYSLIALFVFSAYGGYFGAGVGIILLAILQIMGYTDFHRANALKNLLASAFIVVGIVIYGFNDLIAWPEALWMMAGATIGGYFSGRLGRYVNEQYIKYAISTLGFVLSAVYFYKNFG